MSSALSETALTRRGDPETRARIVAAARRLIEAGNGRTVPMSDIAREAGVSRQALYLHFTDRTALVAAVSRAIDIEVGTEAHQAAIDRAPDGPAALRAAVALEGMIAPRIHAVTTSLESLSVDDSKAAATLRERDEKRLDRCRMVVDVLMSEGVLTGGLAPEAAAVFLWSATSQRSWATAGDVTGWTTDEWVEHTTSVLEAALCDPDSRRKPERTRQRTTTPEYGAEIAGDLADFGAQLVELRYRREHPHASDQDVRTAVRAWWSDRRGEPGGDVAGAVRVRSARR